MRNECPLRSSHCAVLFSREGPPLLRSLLPWSLGIHGSLDHLLLRARRLLCTAVLLLKNAALCCCWSLGIHRSLGTHISFIRSTTMDSWKDVELKRMLVGGNGKARAFFERHGCPPCNTDDLRTFIVAKYESRAAKLYKEKIEAEANGQRFQEPAPVQTSSSRGASRGSARSLSSNSSRTKAADSWGDDDWGADDWGGSSSSSKKEPSRTPLARSASAGSVTQFTGSRTTSGGGAFAGLAGGTRQVDGASSQNSSRVDTANAAWNQLSGSPASGNTTAPSRTTSGGGAFAGASATPTPAPAPQPAARMSAAERAKAKYSAEARADSARIAGLTGTSNSPRPGSRAGSAAAKNDDSWGDDWEDDWGASKPGARKPAARAATKPAARTTAAKTATKPKPKLKPKKSVPGPDDDWDW